MKKVLAILMAACLCVSLAACGGNGDNNGNNSGDNGNNGSVPLGEHKHVYTNKSSCDLCGEEWHATETDAYVFFPIRLNGVDGYDVVFGEETYISYPVNPETGIPDYTQEPIYEVEGKPFEEEEIVLPCVHDGKPVISVGFSRPCVSETVKKITIPDSVISFGIDGVAMFVPQSHGAFNRCDSLEEIVLPYEPFLGNVEHPYGNRDASPLSYNSLFSGVVYPESPLSQNYQDGALYIGDYLIDVDSFTDRVFSVKEGTKGIAASAFCYFLENTSTLEEVRIPASVAEIGECAFSYSYSPFGEHKSSLKKVTFAENSQLKKIYNHAFFNCQLLTGIDLPDGLEAIGEDAFGFCTSIAEFEIPDSVRRVGQNALRLTLFETAFMTRLDPYGSYTAEYNMQGNEIYNGNCLIKVNPDFEGVYTVREGTTAIAGGAFRDCNKITSVVLPKDLTAIESGLFNECSSLESVELPKSVKYIGDYAFENCVSLTSINIPEGVTEIGVMAFDGCSALQSVTLPGTLTKLGLRAFSLCNSLKKVVLPHSLSEVGQNLFMSDTALTEIEFRGTVEEWFRIAFTGSYSERFVQETIGDASIWTIIDYYMDSNHTIVCTDGTIAMDGTVTEK